MKNADSNIIIAFVGNKLDLEDQRKISKEEVTKFCEEKGILSYECSAKTGENIKEVFVEVMNKIPMFEKTNFSVSQDQVTIQSAHQRKEVCQYAKC